MCYPGFRSGPFVGLPSWGCDASGCLGPAVFMVFAMGSPVSGRDCVLPQSSIVPKTFPPGGLGSWPRRVPLPQTGVVYSFGMWSPFGSVVSFCHS